MCAANLLNAHQRGCLHAFVRHTCTQLPVAAESPTTLLTLLLFATH